MFNGYFCWVWGSTTNIFLERVVALVEEVERGESARALFRETPSLCGEVGLRGDERGVRISDGSFCLGSTGEGANDGGSVLMITSLDGNSVLMVRSLDFRDFKMLRLLVDLDFGRCWWMGGASLGGGASLIGLLMVACGLVCCV